MKILVTGFNGQLQKILHITYGGLQMARDNTKCNTRTITECNANSESSVASKDQKLITED